MIDEEFDLIGLIEKYVESLEQQLKQREVSLVGPIFNENDKHHFKALNSDERRYSQIIFNFLSNSLKFTPAGGKITVSLNLLEV